ncbi:uncharacterized protein LOC119613771 [Lucilia sericata]|uniref:uncharacterized protein LOC119613771 n=1 Tax=Lucilia sericata TaxID=13632 RepID=UPI0018A7F6FE|nr:uncharacterized protein LOC119613771 [Lucilia sericata]
MAENNKKNKNNLTSGIKCCVRICKKSKRNNKGLKMFKFPTSDRVLGKIWREKCQIPEQDYERNLYICEHHFPSNCVGRKKLKADAIPTIDLNIIAEDSQDIIKLRDSSNELELKKKNCTANESVTNKAADANNSNTTIDQTQPPNTTSANTSQQYMALAWALKLTKMSHSQNIFAKKLINDVILNGELGLLNLNTGLSNISSLNYLDEDVDNKEVEFIKLENINF